MSNGGQRSIVVTNAGVKEMKEAIYDLPWACYPWSSVVLSVRDDTPMTVQLAMVGEAAIALLHYNSTITSWATPPGAAKLHGKKTPLQTNPRFCFHFATTLFPAKPTRVAPDRWIYILCNIIQKSTLSWFYISSNKCIYHVTKVITRFVDWKQRNSLWKK